MKMKGYGAKRKCVEVRDEMKYIPLTSTVESLIQNCAVLSEVRMKWNSCLALQFYCGIARVD